MPMSRITSVKLLCAIVNGTVTSERPINQSIRFICHTQHITNSKMHKKKTYVWYDRRYSDSKANSAFHPSVVGKWVPATPGKAKTSMVHFVSGWTRGVQIKLWDPLRTRAIPECLRGVFTTRRYTNPRLPYITLPYGRSLMLRLYGQY